MGAAVPVLTSLGIAKTTLRSARPILERSRALGLVAADAFVAGLSADVETQVQQREVGRALAIVGDEA
jgi:hypothetical protein